MSLHLQVLNNVDQFNAIFIIQRNFIVIEKVIMPITEEILIKLSITINMFMKTSL